MGLKWHEIHLQLTKTYNRKVENAEQNQTVQNTSMVVNGRTTIKLNHNINMKTLQKPNVFCIKYKPHPITCALSENVIVIHNDA